MGPREISNMVIAESWRVGREGAGKYLLGCNSLNQKRPRAEAGEIQE